MTTAAPAFTKNRVVPFVVSTFVGVLVAVVAYALHDRGVFGVDAVGVEGVFLCLVGGFILGVVEGVRFGFGFGTGVSVTVVTVGVLFGFALPGGFGFMVVALGVASLVGSLLGGLFHTPVGVPVG